MNEPALKIDFIIPASPNDAFFSQIAMFRLALDALGHAYREARLVTVFGDSRITPLPDRWKPHFERIDVEWADPSLFEHIGYHAQSERRFGVLRPDADIAVFCDADTLLIRPFEPDVIAAARRGALGGVIAHYHFPWADTSGNPSADWFKLSRFVTGQEIDLLYRYSLMEPEEINNCPFYVNLGFLIGSPKAMTTLNNSCREIFNDVFEIINNYFFEQVTVALGIAKNELPTTALPIRYNFPNDPIADRKYSSEISQICLIHYLRTELFDRHEIFANGHAFEAFMRLQLGGSNRIFQDRVREITGGVYPFTSSPRTQEGSPRSQQDRGLQGRGVCRGYRNSLLLSLDHPTCETETSFRAIALLVLGMHRSGTSSVAGALVGLGGAPPFNLMPPHASNERGFWESTVLATLNDEILATAGSNWQDWSKFDPSRICGAVADTLSKRARAALTQEFGDALFPVIKDPRMCRLMSFWAPVLAEAEWSVRAILPLRSPLEVAWSLNHRDGIGPSYGCLLWLRHILDAEVETRGMARAVLDWRTFLHDRRGALARVSEQVGLIWPHWCESALADVDEFVSVDLWHQRATEDDLRAHPAISDLVRETYGTMLELVEDPRNNCVLRRLDDLRARFETAAAIFGHAVQELEDDLRRARSHAAERDALAAQVAAERDALAAEVAAERDALAAQVAMERDAAARHAAERDALAAQVAMERDAFELQLAAAKSERDSLSGRILEANRQIARAEAMIAHIGNGLAEQRRTSKRARLRFPWKARSKPLQKDLETIRNSVFFDKHHYLETNPDVRATGLDAAFHYLVHGGLEGRDPGPFFSTKAYLARYPDVAEAGLNALLHYEARGRRENRHVLAWQE